MRPRIGVTSGFHFDQREHRLRAYLDAAYADAIFAAGGIPWPVPVPPTHDGALLDELLAGCDGLVFTGGPDLDPRSYGDQQHPKTEPLHERRGAFELDFFRRADAARVPILAICLGHQVAHVARGGGLVQHVDDLPRQPALPHTRPDTESAYHEVEVAADSRLARVLGLTRLEVNSRHHQVVAPQRPGRGLRTVALAADGVLEGSEDCDGRFLLTVQWHPENLCDRPPHRALFEALVSEATHP